MRGAYLMLQRVASVYALPALLIAAASYLGWGNAGVDVSDTLLLFLTIAGFIAFRDKFIEALTAPDPFGPQEFATLGLLNVFIVFALQAVWSTRVRNLSHVNLYEADVVIRLLFRFYAVQTVVFFLAAQGIVDSTKVPAARWWRIFTVAVAALTIVTSVALVGHYWVQGKERAEMHDFAPIGPDTDGRP